MSTEIVAQPVIRAGPQAEKQGYQVKGTGRYQPGGPKSVRRLAMLKFDPIDEKVNLYRKLKEKLEWYEARQRGEIVLLYPEDHKYAGKPVMVREEDVIQVFNALDKCANDLLRYGYGRVPESVDVNLRPPSALTVQLTKKGETYVVNDEQPDDGGDDGFYDETN